MSKISRQHGLFSLAVIVFLSGCLIAGCGYHLRATGEPIGTELESLAIPLITSSSSEIGFEADFTRIIREEFISHGKVPLLSEKEAQAVLIGRVYDIKTEALSYDSQELTVSGQVTTYEVTSSRRLKIKLDMQLIERASGKVMWHEVAMEEKASFALDTDPLATRYRQQQALKKIARRLAKRVYLKTMERF